MTDLNFDEAWEQATTGPLPSAGGEDPTLPPWDPPVVRTAREVCATPLPDWSPVLGAEDRGPLIQRGWRIIIGGESGAGKTSMCMRILRAVCLGEQFLEWRGYGEPALAIDLEQGERTVHRRLEEAGLDQCDNLDYVRIPDGLALEKDPRHQEWLEGVLRAKPYSVVLIDPLYKLHQGDANDERAVVDLMRMIDRWREELNFALIIPAHLRKADKTGRSKPSMDDIAGNASIIRGAEVVLGIQFISGFPEIGEGVGKSRLHFWKDRDGDLPAGSHWDLNFTIERGYWIDSAKKSSRDVLMERLAKAWPDWQTLKQLSEVVGVGTRRVTQLIAEIRAEGIEVQERRIPGLQTKQYRFAEVYDGLLGEEDGE